MVMVIAMVIAIARTIKASGLLNPTFGTRCLPHRNANTTKRRPAAYAQQKKDKEKKPGYYSCSYIPNYGNNHMESIRMSMTDAQKTQSAPGSGEQHSTVTNFLLELMATTLRVSVIDSYNIKVSCCCCWYCYLG